MAGFYGYSPENFIPDNSIWAKIGGIAAETIQKLPEAIELEKAYEEGKVNNEDIYQATMNEIKDLSDEEVKTFFGRTKDFLVKIGKPRRREGAEYMVRNSKIFGDGLRSVYAKKNLSKAQGHIGAIGRNMDVADEVRGVMVDQIFKGAGMDVQGDLQKIGQSVPAGESSPVMKPIANYATPEQVQSIASKYNVPLDQLQPEMTQAKNRVDAQQLRQIDTTGTQATNMQAIGGLGQGIGDNTMKAINTLPNETQEASAMISAKNAASAGVKADADKVEAQAKLKGEENKGNEQLFKNLKDYLTATENAMAKAQDDYNNLQKTLVTTYNDDEKDDILKQMKVINGKIQKYSTEIEKTREQMRPKIDIKEEEKQTRNASESTKKDTSKILSYVKNNGSDYETGIFNYAKSVEQTTGKQLGITVEKLRTLLDPSLPEGQRATVSQIVQAIREQAGLE